MKAIKIYNIDWNLNAVINKDDVLKNLPKEIFSKVKDDFNTSSVVPKHLKKKYGYDINSYCVENYRIAKSLEDLLEISSTTDGNNGKAKVIVNSSGKLTPFGKCCLENLKGNLLWRIRLEKNGTLQNKMPKVLDETLLSLEYLTGLDWHQDGYKALIIPVLTSIGKDFSVKNASDINFED